MLYYPSIALFFQFTDKLYIELAHIESVDVHAVEVDDVRVRDALVPRRNKKNMANKLKNYFRNTLLQEQEVCCQHLYCWLRRRITITESWWTTQN